MTGRQFNLAESEGFEPPVPFDTTVFKTAAFDHSANSPRGRFYFNQLQKQKGPERLEYHIFG